MSKFPYSVVPSYLMNVDKNVIIHYTGTNSEKLSRESKKKDLWFDVYAEIYQEKISKIFSYELNRMMGFEKERDGYGIDIEKEPEAYEVMINSEMNDKPEEKMYVDKYNEKIYLSIPEYLLGDLFQNFYEVNFFTLWFMILYNPSIKVESDDEFETLLEDLIDEQLKTIRGLNIFTDIDIEPMLKYVTDLDLKNQKDENPSKRFIMLRRYIMDYLCTQFQNDSTKPLSSYLFEFVKKYKSYVTVLFGDIDIEKDCKIDGGGSNLYASFYRKLSDANTGRVYKATKKKLAEKNKNKK